MDLRLSQPIHARAGPITIALVWVDAAGQPLGEPIHLPGPRVEPLPPAITEVPSLSRPVTATLGAEDIELLGSDLPEQAAPGEALTPTLVWRARTTSANRAYTVLLHLVDADGNVVAQGDGLPVRPTTSWRRGEVVSDERLVVLPADLPAGTYTVLVGLYDATDPAYPRLPVTVDGVPRDDGRVPLGTIAIGP
jgi:hypothetical protein